FSGTVTGMQISPPMNGMDAGVSILVKSSNGGTSLVHLGPFWFVNNLKPAIHVKDKVTVTGSKILVNNRTAILASTVAIGNKLLTTDERKVTFVSRQSFLTLRTHFHNNSFTTRLQTATNRFILRLSEGRTVQSKLLRLAFATVGAGGLIRFSEAGVITFPTRA